MPDQLLLALDFGGTKLSAAVAAPGERQWRRLERVLSPMHPNARTDMEAMLALARRLLSGAIPMAIGVSFGGPVDARRGRVILSHHVPGWEDMPLADELRTELGVPVSVDNDANVGALGEYSFGAGQGCSSLLYITVSTGVGGGWVLDGRIYSGADGMAGEIGHTVVDPSGPECICGRRGCVESMACGPAIARNAREQLTREPQRGALLRKLVDNNLDAVTGERVARAAAQGDELARAVLLDAARALGFGIGTAVTLMNPERVVIGGGVVKSGDAYLAAVRAEARANSLPQMRVDIVPAALGDDAPLWGAMALAGMRAEG